MDFQLNATPSPDSQVALNLGETAPLTFLVSRAVDTTPLYSVCNCFLAWFQVTTRHVFLSIIEGTFPK